MTAPLSATNDAPSTATASPTAQPSDDGPEPLWSIRHTITGRRQTVTTTHLNQLLRDDTIRIFDVTPVPRRQATTATTP